MNRLYLVAYGLVFIVGMWLLIATVIMSDILHGILFMGILLMLYALTVNHFYLTTKRKREPQIHKQIPKVAVNGIAAIQTGEEGITLIVPKRS